MKRILITRSSHQASELADALRACGLDPILIPSIEIVEPGSFAPLDLAINGLDQFDWILFTSANAVHAFAGRLSSPLPAALKIAAIGPATVRALESFSLHAQVVPPIAVAESFLEALLPYAAGPHGQPTRFLLVRAEVARDLLPDALRSAGAEVTVVAAYRNVVPHASIPAMRQLFESPSSYPSAITFTSSSTATNLFTLLELAGLQLPPEVLRISIGPITSKTLRELGFPPHAEADAATIPSLVDSVMRLLGG